MKTTVRSDATNTGETRTDYEREAAIREQPSYIICGPCKRDYFTTMTLIFAWLAFVITILHALIDMMA